MIITKLSVCEEVYIIMDHRKRRCGLIMRQGNQFKIELYLKWTHCESTMAAANAWVRGALAVLESLDSALTKMDVALAEHIFSRIEGQEIARSASETETQETKNKPNSGGTYRDERERMNELLDQHPDMTEGEIWDKYMDGPRPHRPMNFKASFSHDIGHVDANGKADQQRLDYERWMGDGW